MRIYLILILILLIGCSNKISGNVVDVPVTGSVVLIDSEKSDLPTTQIMTTDTVQSSGSDKIRIGSFNIQIFGQSKASNPEIMSYLVQIISEFDIVAIQEIRDKDNLAFPQLIKELNAYSSDKHFDYVISDRLGRTSSKEQYAIIFEDFRVEYLDLNIVYPDSSDDFEREPYIAHFIAGDFDFTLVNIHTKPEDATDEIMKLEDVVDYAAEFTKENDVIVLGDFNSDGSYFNEDYNEGFRSSNYLWAISDSMDTTVASASNTYDRIVFRKADTEADYAGKSDVFRYDTAMDVPTDLVPKISDHYPIYAEFFTDKDDD